MVNRFQSLKLLLLNVGYANLDSRWSFNNVISPFSRLYLITEGKATVYHHGRKFDLLPGNMYLIPSFTYSSYHCDSMHTQYYVSFLEELGSGMSLYDFVDVNYQVEATDLDTLLFQKLLTINPNRMLVNNDPKQYDNRLTLKGFEEQNQQLNPSSYLETSGILKVLFSKFIMDRPNFDDSKVLQPKLDRVLNYISENLHSDLRLKELADLSNISVDYFSKSFKKYMGVNPSRYIQDKRLERGLLLLLTTNLTVKEIANTIGFEAHQYFSRFFKERTGESPTEFRKENRAI